MGPLGLPELYIILPFYKVWVWLSTVWSPLSPAYSRKISLLASVSYCMCFSIYSQRTGKGGWPRVGNNRITWRDATGLGQPKVLLQSPLVFPVLVGLTKQNIPSPQPTPFALNFCHTCKIPLKNLHYSPWFRNLKLAKVGFKSWVTLGQNHPDSNFRTKRNPETYLVLLWDISWNPKVIVTPEVSLKLVLVRWLVRISHVL